MPFHTLHLGVIPYGDAQSFAVSIHDRSDRAQCVFDSVDLSQLDEKVHEASIFGFVISVFTGGTRERMGTFEMAQGGTVHLHAIECLTKDSQRLIENAIIEGCFCKTGDNTKVPLNVALISSCAHPINEMISTGEFSSKLFSLLSGVDVAQQ